jgi:hypothetical protein
MICNLSQRFSLFSLLVFVVVVAKTGSSCPRGRSSTGKKV